MLRREIKGVQPYNGFSGHLIVGCACACVCACVCVCTCVCTCVFVDIVCFHERETEVTAWLGLKIETWL